MASLWYQQVGWYLTYTGNHYKSLAAIVAPVAHVWVTSYRVDFHELGKLFNVSFQLSFLQPKVFSARLAPVAWTPTYTSGL
jgi:hypothetical protein